MNNPDIEKDFNDLEFGRGELLVEHIGPGLFIGRLVFGETYQFRLEGVANPGDPPTFTFQGKGDAEESQGQVYEYFGCLMPLWPHDRRKRPTIVGTVIRAAAPDADPKVPKGSAASFIALKRDDLPAPTPPTPEPSKPEPSKPAPTKPESKPSKPAPTKPESKPSKPEPSKPEPSKSEPDPPKPDHSGSGHAHAEGDPYRRKT